MNTFILVLVVFALGCSLATNFWLLFGAKKEEKRPEDSFDNFPEVEPKPLPPDLPSIAAFSLANKSNLEKVYGQAEELEKFFKRAAHPKDLLERQAFKQGVELLCDPGFKTDELLGYGAGENGIIASMAFEALFARREHDPDVSDQVIATISKIRPRPAFFALRALQPSPDKSLIGAVTANVNAYWADEPLMLSMIRDFVTKRLAEGEVPSFKGWLGEGAEEAEDPEIILDYLGMEQLEPLRKELHEWQRTRVDTKALSAIGSVWDVDDQVEHIVIQHPTMTRLLKELESNLLSEPRRSVLLVGRAGVGKTTLYSVFAKSLQKEGWTIFEAGAMDLIAGQAYIGDLEERIRDLVRNLGGSSKVLWVIPNFHELQFTGAHKFDPRGALDLLMPFLESGKLIILGETEPDAYERMLQNKPRLRTSLTSIAVSPLDSEETLVLARKWNQRAYNKLKMPLIEYKVLEEAFHMSQQFLDKEAAPGNLINFLKRTHGNRIDTKQPIGTNDLLKSLTLMTGLPVSILDQHQDLDLSALKDLFLKRVLGQPEAVDCLVERVAMIKAGLTDPTKPAGVFLFVGPTGTGKTEIAKTLAQFLFGSPNRMIRLDMSEFMGEESFDRILGEQDRNTNARALVNLIRNQPFSVILLDEFEKAHRKVWDLFLQVFDDGRLNRSAREYGGFSAFDHHYDFKPWCCHSCREPDWVWGGTLKFF